MICVGDIVTLTNCRKDLVGAKAEVMALPREHDALSRYQVLVCKRLTYAKRCQLRTPEPVVSWDECVWEPVA